MSELSDTVWKSDSLTATYLDGVRAAIPLAATQIEIMLRLVRSAVTDAQSILDLGCGDGILGQAVLDQHPQARAVFLDFSQPMLSAAQERLAGKERVDFVFADYGRPNWIEQLPSVLETGQGAFDVIVSGYSIHHQPDSRKEQLYQELFDLLRPGGIFLNIEHVSSPSAWLELRFEELFVDNLVSHHRSIGSTKSSDEIGRDFYRRPDKVANILAPVELQCEWLKEIGFIHVDCYLKIYELALFGGIKAK